MSSKKSNTWNKYSNYVNAAIILVCFAIPLFVMLFFINFNSENIFGNSFPLINLGIFFALGVVVLPIHYVFTYHRVFSRFAFVITFIFWILCLVIVSTLNISNGTQEYITYIGIALVFALSVGILYLLNKYPHLLPIKKTFVAKKEKKKQYFHVDEDDEIPVDEEE